jgi:hypothetical protein
MKGVPLKKYACKTISAVATLAVGLITCSAALAGDTMPVAEQNALVHRQCAFCHNDARMAGGFSLDHFDAGRPDPSLVAMMLSKLTRLSLEQVEAAQNDSDAAALVVDRLKTGAMGAAGKGVPERATQDALVSALSAEARDATNWTVITQGPLLTAGILRELPSTTHPGDTDMFRLGLTCNANTREAEIQVGWADNAPEEGRPMSVSVDGNAPLTVKAEGGKKQGSATGPGSVILPITLPAQTLTISNALPDETVTFPLGGLPETVHQCFAGSSIGR